RCVGHVRRERRRDPRHAMNHHRRGGVMERKSTYGAVVMGEESLLIHGAEAWLERGHAIVAVVTDVREIEVWAERRGLRVVRPDDGLVDALAELRFDYLFSLANMRGIPEAALGLAEVIHY